VWRARMEGPGLTRAPFWRLVSRAIRPLARRWPLPTLPDGLVLDLRDSHISDLERAVIILGRAERSEMDLARRLLSTATAVDVVELGTSVGVVGARVVRHLARGQRYVGLEMQAWAVPIGERTVRRHAPAGVSVDVLWGAVCSTRRTVGTYAPGPIASAGAMSGDEVPTLRLGDVLDRGRITGDYLLVMDIEGSESDVFTNDTAALARCQGIVVELHDAGPTETNPWGCSAKHALDMAVRLGFRACGSIGPVYYLERDAKARSTTRSDVRPDAVRRA
jgi:FkbM family methyltransferase